MIVLSIDPGITTGIAVIETGGKVLFSSWIQGVEPGKDDFHLHLAKIDTDFRCTDVVIERGPDLERNASDFLNRQDAVLRQLFPSATWWTPNEWKPTPRGKAMLPHGITIHERDAIRMGLEFVHRGTRSMAGAYA